MLKAGGTIQLSASDLVGHLYCRYLTSLDLAVANGTLGKPKIWNPVAESLVERGIQHEKGYLAHLESQGLFITTIDGVGIDAAAVANTLEAMKAGAPVIAQGALQADHWS